jgi:TetR/AcrR family transcriptional regulator, regulator of mycofactocin system
MPATGRPPSTTHAEIEAAALGLFERRGFEQTSIEEIAAAVGVGRRTIFRYFPSKNDVVWGDFEWVNRRLRGHLEESGAEVPLMEALRRAAVLSNRYPDEELPALRQRLTLITTVPALQAHSMLRYASWRAVVAEWSAPRLGVGPEELAPQALGHFALGASTAAFSRWVENPGLDLERCLDGAYRLLAGGFAAAEHKPGR